MSLRQKPPQPECLPGFEHIKRYWDASNQAWVAKILPGELYVTRDPDELVTTVLGSCVSACIRDNHTGIGGINHFMLPLKVDESSDNWMDQATRYGSYAMEQLINEILKAGGSKRNLEMKLTGGAKVIVGNSASEIGQRNIDFVMEFAEVEGIQVISQDLGDIFPRKIIYYPASGRLRVKRLRSMHNDTLFQREELYVKELQTDPVEGDVELF